MIEHQDYRTLHEVNPLAFVMDTVTAVRGWLDDANNKTGDLVGLGKAIRAAKQNAKGRPLQSNLAKSAKGLTAVFPVIVTESTDIQTAMMIAKAVERKAVGMLQMLFAAYQITDARNASDYMKNFHTNISSDVDLSTMGIDDVLDTAMDGLGESTTSIEANELIAACIEDCKYNCQHVLESEVVNPAISTFVVKRSPLAEDAYHIAQPVPEYRILPSNDVNNPRIFTADNNTEIDPVAEPLRYQQALDTVRYRLKTSNLPIQDRNRLTDTLGKQVLDSDIKKANEAQPSMMIINFITTIGNTQSIANTCVIGVKAVLHYVKSQDLINRVILKNSDNRALFNFIRATTREIAFFKDFLFSVNKAKVDAIAKSGKGSTDRLWKLLELRANKLKTAKATNMRESDFAAITTLIMSNTEVEYIKKEHRIDLSKPGTLLAIMRGYNLMGAAIIDNVTERVDFLFDDGSKDFETYSFASLEREDSGSMYKKVINLMMKGR